MNERYEIQRELKKFFEKITLDNCGHLLQSDTSPNDWRRTGLPNF